jgi:hypothetical protein
MVKHLMLPAIWGWIDQHGNSLGKPLPVDEHMKRTSDPDVDLRYTAQDFAPYRVTRYIPQLELTYLNR